MLATRVATSESMSSASRSTSTSISAMKSPRVSSSQSTSVRRKLLTKPLMWLSGNRSSWAVAARNSSWEQWCPPSRLGLQASALRADADRSALRPVNDEVPGPMNGPYAWPDASSWPSGETDRELDRENAVIDFSTGVTSWRDTSRLSRRGTATVHPLAPPTRMIRYGVRRPFEADWCQHSRRLPPSCP